MSHGSTTQVCRCPIIVLCALAFVRLRCCAQRLAFARELEVYRLIRRQAPAGEMSRSYARDALCTTARLPSRSTDIMQGIQLTPFPRPNFVSGMQMSRCAQHHVCTSRVDALCTSGSIYPAFLVRASGMCLRAAAALCTIARVPLTVRRGAYTSRRRPRPRRDPGRDGTSCMRAIVHARPAPRARSPWSLRTNVVLLPCCAQLHACHWGKLLLCHCARWKLPAKDLFTLNLISLVPVCH